MKWVVQSSFKIDWLSLFFIKIFLCSGEAELLSEQFQSCYFIFFFSNNTLELREREFREDWLIFYYFYYLERANEENSLKTVLFCFDFLLFYIFFLIFRFCCFNLYFYFLLFSFFIINYFFKSPPFLFFFLSFLMENLK